MTRAAAAEVAALRSARPAYLHRLSDAAPAAAATLITPERARQTGWHSETAAEPGAGAPSRPRRICGANSLRSVLSAQLSPPRSSARLGSRGSAQLSSAQHSSALSEG
jgi:hypothetical protein